LIHIVSAADPHHRNTQEVLKKLFLSIKWSLAGFVYAFKHEQAFRLEVYAVLVLTPLAIYISKDCNQFLWLFFSAHLVLVAELFNTAIEAVIDRIGKDHHLLAKHAKDAGSAAVFYTIIMAIIVWSVIIYKRAS